MRVALVLVFAALAWSAQASKRDPVEYLRFQEERKWVKESFGDFLDGDVPPKTTPESAVPNRLVPGSSSESDLETGDCSKVLSEQIALALRDEPRYSDDFRKVKSLARSTLKKCAKEFDGKFKDSDKYLLEWSLDKFFGKVAVTDSGITDEVLFEAAASFDLKLEVFHNEKLCKVAVALNGVRKGESVYNWMDQVVMGKVSTRYSQPMLEDMLKISQDIAETADCEAEMRDLFRGVCGADRSGIYLDLERVNLAAVFDADLTGLLGPRAAKYREYQRICYNQEN